MKRKRESEIILNALRSFNVPITETVENAVNNGLKTIRREKFEERHPEAIQTAIEGKHIEYESILKTDAVDEPKTERNPADRLEEALLTFIEREIQKPSPDATTLNAIPAMADVLVKLWSGPF